MKTKRKAVRCPITGKIDHYTNTKTAGLRNPITGKIQKRVSKKKAAERWPAHRTYTIGDEIERIKRRRKKDSSSLF